MIWPFVEDRFRYVILLVGCACLTSISSNMLAFNIAEVCMGSNDTNHVKDKFDVSFLLKRRGSTWFILARIWHC